MIEEPSWAWFHIGATVDIKLFPPTSARFPSRVVGYYDARENGGSYGYVLRHDPYGFIHVEPHERVIERIVR